MQRHRRALLGALAAGCCAWSAQPVRANTLPAAPTGGEDVVQRFARGVLASNDHRHRPFAVVDKPHARMVLFGSDGSVLGAAPVLLGLQRGDHAVPGTGSKPLSAIRPEERTTPAGRFDTEPGINVAGEALVWMDYDAGLAIHRLRPGPAREQRARRLASRSPADKRISLGCVVVAPAFYVNVVAPVLGRRRGVAYVLPEHEPLHAVFGRHLVAGLADD